MLEVQKYLRSGKTLQDLESEYAVSSNVRDGLVILNYCQIDSAKTAPIVMECRGLVLKMDDWSVVACPLKRFYNYGECPEITGKFDWNNFTCEEKVDGSLVLMYWCPIRLKWVMNTRNSFGDGEINDSGLTWEDLFFSLINPNDTSLLKFYTYIFELCSPFNKVVTYHEKPKIVLLAIMDKHFCDEADASYFNWFAETHGFKVPPKFNFKNITEAQNHLTDTPFSFEGFVLRDCNGLRLKMKSPAYLRAHYLFSNGNSVANKNLIPLILYNQNDLDELLSYYPEFKGRVDALQGKIGNIILEIQEFYNGIAGLVPQKEFASHAVTKPYAAILFEARKQKKDIHAIMYSTVGEKYLAKFLS